MNAKLTINTAQCIERFGVRYKKAQVFLDTEVLKDSAPYTPFREGDLMRSGPLGTTIGSGKVEYNVPYAKAMYYGKNFNFYKEKHPKACAQWFEKAKAAKKSSWIKGVKKIMKE